MLFSAVCLCGRRGMQFYEMKIAFGFLLHSTLLIGIWKNHRWSLKSIQQACTRDMHRERQSLIIDDDDSLLIINRNEMQTIDEADISWDFWMLIEHANQQLLSSAGLKVNRSLSYISFCWGQMHAIFFYIHNQSTDNIVDIIFKIFHNDASNSFDNSISLYLANIL